MPYMSTGSDIPPAEQILASHARVLLLCGPAASGKTSAAIDLYRHFRETDGRPACILLAPNAPAAADLRRRLLAAEASGVLIQPQVMSFAALGGRILAATDRSARTVGPLQRYLLLRQILNELNRSGRLRALGPVTDTPGIITALDRSIAELKRAAVAPEDLARAVGDRKDKTADLLAVYREYQRRLRRENLSDVEGTMWLARLALQDLAGQPVDQLGLPGVRAIVADGFTHPARHSRAAGPAVEQAHPHASGGRRRAGADVVLGGSHATQRPPGIR
jgi:ATP-dependent helicase/DNAse subunit B